jgi:hypothetical protein
MMPAAVAAAGFLGTPFSNALATVGISTVVRSGTISASIAMCARCSIARTPAPMPPLYPTNAAGLLRNAKLANTLSIAFFSTPGTLWLYSGVMNRYASPSAMRWFHRRTTGSE